MDKKLLIITFFLALILCLGVTLIEEKNKKLEVDEITDSQRFKNEYESLNGTIHKEDNEIIRTLYIQEENPIIYKTVEDVKEMINNKETFILYIGKSDDSWCRSMIETLLEVADNLILKQIYYIDITDIDKEELAPLLKEENINIPIVMMIKDGKIVNETVGISEKQIDGYVELTDEIKEDMYHKLESLLKCVTEEICNEEF